MKKILLISSILTAVFLVGCNAKDKEKTNASTGEASSPVAQVDSNESNQKTVKYETEDKKQFTL